MFLFPRHKKTARAFALVSVLVLLSILSLIALEFSQRSGINMRMAINDAHAKKALYYAYGGYQVALSLLANDTNDYDGSGDFWYGLLPAVPFGDGSISLVVEDEQARFNLTALVTSYGQKDERRSVMLSRIFDVLSIDSSVVDSLVDWQDTDDIELAGGAEVSYYNYLTPPMVPRNAQMRTTGEALLVRGMDRELFFLPPAARTPLGNEEYQSLERYVTVYGDGKINVNTAPEPVLLCLSADMDTYITQEIIERRNEGAFLEIEDLKNVESVSDTLYDEISSLITVSSDVFRIKASGSAGGFTRNITAVVRRRSGGFTIVYYNRSL
jgi:general secretion pathway protein K